MRINKYIAKTGYCSRRKADSFIESGAVTINGKTAEVGDRVEDSDQVAIYGEPISTDGKEDLFLLLHKPAGVISSGAEDANNSVYDYLDSNERLFYVGRLDVASEGLMLFTNNGDIAQKLAHGSGKMEKEYIVTVQKPMEKKDLRKMREGIELDGELTKPARTKAVGVKKFHLILTEGRNRQIRRMCEALGYEVVNLKRIRIAHLRLRDLGAGNTRLLSKKERRELLEGV
ncbi:MAG: pseudouridine synthase [bacterium]|nr:pseudouridine synthase [bacterium]